MAALTPVLSEPIVRQETLFDPASGIATPHTMEMLKILGITSKHFTTRRSQ